jgi:hypothetical protein
MQQKEVVREHRAFLATISNIQRLRENLPKTTALDVCADVPPNL